MREIIFVNTVELKRTKEELKEKLNVEITLEGKKVTVRGDSLDEYEAGIVLDAMSLGFSAAKALDLKDESKIFRVLNIKSISRKSNLKEVRARVIGSKGRTKKTMEDISGCDIIIRDNDVGIIADAEVIDEVVTAVSNLIRGTKQANTYRYLEKMNAKKKEM